MSWLSRSQILELSPKIKISTPGGIMSRRNRTTAEDLLRRAKRDPLSPSILFVLHIANKQVWFQQNHIVLTSGVEFEPMISSWNANFVFFSDWINAQVPSDFTCFVTEKHDVGNRVGWGLWDRWEPHWRFHASFQETHLLARTSSAFQS